MRIQAQVPHRKFNIIAVFTVVMLLSLCLSSCGVESSVPIQYQAGTYPIDPLFKEYVQNLGGEALLGSAISQAFDENDQICQYLANALVCQNPHKIGTDRFYLIPLGNQFSITNSSGYTPSSPDAVLINGFEIYPDFLDLYNQLNQKRAVGNPLSQPRFDFEQGRVEQYFEKVGMVYRFDMPKGSIQLLPYGAYACNTQCREFQYTPFVPNRQIPDTPFLVPLERLGGVQIFGQPISTPYIASDGSLEQIFENAVIYSSPEDTSRIFLRPIAIELGMIYIPPAERKYGLEDHVTFYPVKNELGYHVPVLFDSFIAQHGGTEISGQPIADTMIYNEDQIARQCFTNYCLEYHPDAPEGLQIRITALGIRYKNNGPQMSSSPSQQASETQTPELNAPANSAPEVSSSNEPSAPAPTQENIGKSTHKNPLPKGGEPAESAESKSAPSETIEPNQEQPAAQPEIQQPVTEAEPSMGTDSIVLLITEQKQQIPANRSQIIHLVVHRKDNLEPIPGLTAQIKLVTPNGELEYTAPPTGSGGRASVAIDPMPELESGSLVTYQVCVKTDSSEPVCAYDSYLIWNYQ